MIPNVKHSQNDQTIWTENKSVVARAKDMGAEGECDYILAALGTYL
jgi:hypothetical protein